MNRIPFMIYKLVVLDTMNQIPFMRYKLVVLDTMYSFTKMP